MLAAARAPDRPRRLRRRRLPAASARVAQAVDEDDELNPLGRLGVFAHCVRCLANRCGSKTCSRRHPEILDVAIERPIIVAGLPRSGTTHLVNLIAADTRLRSLPYWESLEPVPVPGDDPGPTAAIRARRAACRRRADLAQMPLLRRCTTCRPSTSTRRSSSGARLRHLPPRVAGAAPRWRDYYLGLDLRSSYAYLRKVLQVLTWLRGPRRWVLKSPQHLEQLGPLLATFPDATVAITHRDPVAVIQSAITMLAYGDRMRRTRVDLGGTRRILDRSRRALLRACVRDREAAGRAARSTSASTSSWPTTSAWWRGSTRRAGLAMTAGARAAHGRDLAENPRGKHGQVVYDLRGDFGSIPPRCGPASASTSSASACVRGVSYEQRKLLPRFAHVAVAAKHWPPITSRAPSAPPCSVKSCSLRPFALTE